MPAKFDQYYDGLKKYGEKSSLPKDPQLLKVHFSYTSFSPPPSPLRSPSSWHIYTPSPTSLSTPISSASASYLALYDYHPHCPPASFRASVSHFDPRPSTAPASVYPPVEISNNCAKQRGSYPSYCICTTTSRLANSHASFLLLNEYFYRIASHLAFLDHCDPS